MCGIIGTVQNHSRIDLQLFERGLEVLKPRGPDDSGIWMNEEGRVALGSRRLAIHDLSPDGRMPMCDPGGKVWITFNGEIYNFQALKNDLRKQGRHFRTQTDTEVILAAYLEWGTECLEKLNGMFAFAVFDGRNETSPPFLFIARDRAGEKPLFYRCDAQGFAFASELKALLADPLQARQLDPEAFTAFLNFGFVPGELCLISGIRKLPPAHALTYHIQDRCLRRWRYWVLPDGTHSDPRQDENLLDELSTLLQESVRLRLAADVPVGILLSGGIDSSLITAMAARESSVPLKTFTIAFPGAGKFDEAPFARRVSQFFSTDHHELMAESASFELLPALAGYYDEPLADSSVIPTFLVSRLIRQHVTVALGGDGGDELFAGYSHYHQEVRKRQYLRMIPPPVRTALAAGARRWLPVGFRGRNYLSGMGPEPQEYGLSGPPIFDSVARRKILQKEFQNSMPAPANGISKSKSGVDRNSDDWIDRMTRMDFAAYLPDDLLVKVDRASMAVSLEVRSPWLDQKIVEFAFGRVPTRLKANGGEGKILLRQFAKQVLPPDLDLTRKQGFSIPLDKWLRGDWGKYFAEVLSQADTALFRQREIANLMIGQRRGYSNSTRLFALTMFELWRREYHVSWPS